jgi:uncharacterized membrane protein
MVASSIALLVLGYVGFVAFMPEKAAGDQQVSAFLLSLLMLLAGAVGLLGTLAYALVKAATERRRSRANQSFV